MASLLIKNIPRRLHAQLKKRAAANRRSLNSETIGMLEEAVARAGTPPFPAPGPANPWKEILARVPPDAAKRLRALRRLRESLAARDVDFDAWMKTARDSRR
jgi:plasmid stability protein